MNKILRWGMVLLASLFLFLALGQVSSTQAQTITNFGVTAHPVCSNGVVPTGSYRVFAAKWPPDPLVWTNTAYTKGDIFGNYAVTGTQNLYLGMETSGGVALQPIGTPPNANITYATYFNPPTWMSQFSKSTPNGSYTVNFQAPSTDCVPPTPTVTVQVTPSCSNGNTPIGKFRLISTLWPPGSAAYSYTTYGAGAQTGTYKFTGGASNEGLYVGLQNEAGTVLPLTGTPPRSDITYAQYWTDKFWMARFANSVPTGTYAIKVLADDNACSPRPTVTVQAVPFCSNGATPTGSYRLFTAIWPPDFTTFTNGSFATGTQTKTFTYPGGSTIQGLYVGMQSSSYDLVPTGTPPNSNIVYAKYWTTQQWMAHFTNTIPSGTYQIRYQASANDCPSAPTTTLFWGKVVDKDNPSIMFRADSATCSGFNTANFPVVQGINVDGWPVNVCESTTHTPMFLSGQMPARSGLSVSNLTLPAGYQCDSWAAYRFVLATQSEETTPYAQGTGCDASGTFNPISGTTYANNYHFVFKLKKIAVSPSPPTSPGSVPGCAAGETQVVKTTCAFDTQAISSGPRYAYYDLSNVTGTITKAYLDLKPLGGKTAFGGNVYTARRIPKGSCDPSAIGSGSVDPVPLTLTNTDFAYVDLSSGIGKLPGEVANVSTEGVTAFGQDTKMYLCVKPTVSVTPPTTCVCNSNNVCDTSCSFTKYTSNDLSNVSYANPIGCSLVSVPYSTTPSQANKNAWCQRSLRTQGDSDGTNSVDSLDYFYYVQAVSGGSLPSDTAHNVNPDFNGNGSVGTEDRIIIIKKLGG